MLTEISKMMEIFCLVLPLTYQLSLTLGRMVMITQLYTFYGSES